MTKKTTPPVTLVVRRGALRRFDRLKQATQELEAEVIWDRRAQGRGEAPVSEDVEPSKNRRKATPSTWDLADFAVSEKQPSTSGGRSRKS